MTVGHFPPFCEILSESLWDIFLLFVKTYQNDSGTFSFFLWNFVTISIVRMAGGHFPPFCENLSEWQLEIFLLLVKTFQNDSGTFSSIFGKPVRKFHKKEENVPLSVWQFFTKRRKMSHCHSDKFSKKGGKCPTITLTSFHKKEENVLPSLWQVFTKRRKMSHRHYDKFSKKGGKCPTIILTSFHKKEENVLSSFWQVF